MQSEFGRTFNAARQAQGFKSQAQLAAFYAHFDHVEGCSECHALNGSIPFEDGYQPTQGECSIAKSLYIAYLGVSQ